jgi:hypothetical protein
MLLDNGEHSVRKVKDIFGEPHFVLAMHLHNLHVLKEVIHILFNHRGNSYACLPIFSLS